MYRKITFFTLLACLCTPALGANPDQSQPIYIESDKARRDDLNGITTYEGDVVVTQGSLLIRAEKVTLLTSKDGDVKTVVANGAPANYQQKPAEHKAVIKARAYTIEYNIEQERITLTKEAWLNQDGATFEAALIDYNMATEVVNASGGVLSNSNGESTSNGRIQVMIPPKAKP